MNKNIYRFQLMLLLIPILFFIVFTLTPLFGITLAFKDFSYSKGLLSPWNGLANFKYLLHDDPNFKQVFINTIRIGFFRSLLLLIIPLFLVYFIDQIKVKWIKWGILLTAIFPQFLSWVVVGGIFKNMFSINGIVNLVLVKLGLISAPIVFLTSIPLFKMILYLAIMWKETGFLTFLYSVALDTVESQIYEAAYLDGVGEIKLFFYFKLPLIRDQFLWIMALIMIGYSTGAFDAIFNLYNASVYEQIDIIDTYIYRVGIVSGKFSLGAALDLLKNLINFLPSIIVFMFIIKRKGNYNV